MSAHRSTSAHPIYCPLRSIITHIATKSIPPLVSALAKSAAPLAAAAAMGHKDGAGYSFKKVKSVFSISELMLRFFTF